MFEAFRRGGRVSTSGHCMGYRPAAGQPYVWIKYQTAFARSEALAGALLDVGLDVGQTTFVGIYAKNRPEWVLMEQACFCYDMVTVPLYDTLGEEACDFIIEQTDMTLILVDETAKATSERSTDL